MELFFLNRRRIVIMGRWDNNKRFEGNVMQLHRRSCGRELVRYIAGH